MTGARTGHAGTLDPFATGLLLVLSGRATKIAPSLVGLDKRYRTDVDLTARTSTGDTEGRGRGAARAAGLRPELERRLAGLRGEIELPIPAASAVKIGGERAYRLARRGVEVEMPLRRSTVYALDVIAYTDGVVTLDLRVSSGTYVRAIAEALGGHCRTLRRTEVGPFSVADAVAPEAFEPARLLAGVATCSSAWGRRRDRRAASRGARAARAALGCDRHVRRRAPRASARDRGGARRRTCGPRS